MRSTQPTFTGKEFELAVAIHQAAEGLNALAVEALSLGLYVSLRVEELEGAGEPGADELKVLVFKTAVIEGDDAVTFPPPDTLITAGADALKDGMVMEIISRTPEELDADPEAPEAPEPGERPNPRPGTRMLELPPDSAEPTRLAAESIEKLRRQHRRRASKWPPREG